jgi:hypothetical protein
MKFDKWTLGLAAIGVISLTSAAQAQEPGETPMEAVGSAAGKTILSGYVDTSVHWNPGTGNANVPRYAFNSPAKADGFNLDAVRVTLEHPLDESEWAAGYNVSMMFGPDANALGTTAIGGLAGTDFAIRQAYVALRAPIGNGLDLKLGVFDTVIGYETIDAVNNPNYTRSWGFTLEPTTHTGLLGTYRATDWLNLALGVANTTGPIVGGANVGGSVFPVSTGRAQPYKAESYKTYMGSIAITAPDSWSFLSGSTFYGGVVSGWGGGATVAGDTVNLYAGATFATPVTGLRVGVSYDYFGISDQTIPTLGAIDSTWADALGLYISFQATDKLSFHGRGEYVWSDRGNDPLQASTIVELTGTIQYDLWKNVLSRLEVRYDTATDGSHPFGGDQIPAGGGVNGGVSGAPDERNAVLIAGNLIYKF